MRVQVLKPFADRYSFQMYSTGQTIEVDDARAKEMIDRGLAKEEEKAPKGRKKRKE